MQENSPLFSLSIDPVTKEHLSETAKWARFLSIVGLIVLILVTAGGIYSSILLSRVDDMYGYEGRGLGSVMGAGTAIFYIILFVIYIFPIIFTLRFANKMNHALNANDQEALNGSFQNLKVCFRYMGVITIIVLVLAVLTFFLAVMSNAA